MAQNFLCTEKFQKNKNMVTNNHYNDLDFSPKTNQIDILMHEQSKNNFQQKDDGIKEIISMKYTMNSDI